MSGLTFAEREFLGLLVAAYGEAVVVNELRVVIQRAAAVDAAIADHQGRPRPTRGANVVEFPDPGAE